MLRWLTSFVLLALPLASAYQLAAGRAGRGPSFARVASQMQMAPGGPQQMQKIDSKDTYNVMMRVLHETNASVADQISASYHMVDYAFLQKLDQRAESEKDEEVAARTTGGKNALARSGSHGHRSLQKPARLGTAAVWGLEAARAARAYGHPFGKPLAAFSHTGAHSRDQGGREHRDEDADRGGDGHLQGHRGVTQRHHHGGQDRRPLSPGKGEARRRDEHAPWP